VPTFYAHGFVNEAQIPGFYKNETGVFFMSKFMQNNHDALQTQNELNEFNSLLLESEKLELKSGQSIPDIKIKKLTEQDSEEVAEVYRNVFTSYPFPIDNPEYIAATMEKDTLYYGVVCEGNVVALASAETDPKGLNAEMTDFATLPHHRGRGYAILLLQRLEEEMKNRGIKTLYTIARLKSTGMNKTFLRLGYNYAGTLLHNTCIAGNIENMNVYYKQI
jgi:putative beta-lysine N-acetyltransferase